MRMVMMSGGLGNQIFHYIFLRYLEVKTGLPHVIDDTAYWRKDLGNGAYRLDKAFAIQHTKLSDLMGEEKIKKLADELYPKIKNPDYNLVITKATPKSQIRTIKNKMYTYAAWPVCDVITALSAYGYKMIPVQEGDHYMRSCPQYSGDIYSFEKGKFSPDIAKLTGDLYFYGFWENSYWLCEIPDIIFKELQFVPLEGKENIALWNNMISSNNSVAVHIRRTDFIREGLCLSPDYHKRAIGKVREQIESPVFYVFTDDSSYVKNHIEDYGITRTDQYKVVTGNTGDKSYIDMQLMSACRCVIMPNSTFSYSAALLNHRKDKIVYKPDKPRWAIVPEKMPEWIILPRDNE